MLSSDCFFFLLRLYFDLKLLAFGAFEREHTPATCVYLSEKLVLALQELDLQPKRHSIFLNQICKLAEMRHHKGAPSTGNIKSLALPASFCQRTPVIPSYPFRCCGLAWDYFALGRSDAFSLLSCSHISDYIRPSIRYTATRRINTDQKSHFSCRYKAVV